MSTPQTSLFHLGPADPLPELYAWRKGHRYRPSLPEIRVLDPWLLPRLIENVRSLVPTEYPAEVRMAVWYRGPSFRRATHVALLAIPPELDIEIEVPKAA